jgi:hypothetical protein
MGWLYYINKKKNWVSRRSKISTIPKLYNSLMLFNLTGYKQNKRHWVSIFFTVLFLDDGMVFISKESDLNEWEKIKILVLQKLIEWPLFVFNKRSLLLFKYKDLLLDWMDKIYFLNTNFRVQINSFVFLKVAASSFDFQIIWHKSREMKR